MKSKPISHVPHYSVDVEMVILGAIILDSSNCYDILKALNPDFFYTSIHQQLCKVLHSLQAKAWKIDLITAAEECRRQGVEYAPSIAFYLVELTNKVASSANIEYHSLILRQYYLKREVQRLGIQAYDKIEAQEDVLEVMDWVKVQTDLLQAKSMVGLAKKPMLLKDRILAILQITSGSCLDFPFSQEVKALYAGDLVILAARPAMGKSSLAAQIAEHYAKDNIPTGFAALEMTGVNIAIRLMAKEGISTEEMRQGKLVSSDKRLIESLVLQKYDIPFYLEDTVSTLDGIVHWVEQLVALGAKLFVIDYLQLIQHPEKDTNRRVSIISGTLKILAIRYGISIIALSQLSRKGEGGDIRPQLTHLRDSGSLEQDADIVLFIHRPEYYGIYELYNGDAADGMAELITAKHRNGATGTSILSWDAPTTTFSI